jgi:nucleoside-triphosphatase THEP1
MRPGPALLDAPRLAFAFSDYALKERLCGRVCASHGRWLGGYRTLELRPGGKRAGFEVEALGGGRAVLASREIVSPVSFNKYALDLAALEGTALPALEAAAAAGRVLLFDELGPMAMRSAAFSARAVELLFSGSPCLVFFRRGAEVFERAFARGGDTVIMELGEAGWAEAVAAADAWLDAKVRLMGNT